MVPPVWTNTRVYRIKYPDSNSTMRLFCCRKYSVTSLLAVNCLPHIVAVRVTVVQMAAEQAQVKLSAVPKIAWRFIGMNLWNK